MDSEIGIKMQNDLYVMNIAKQTAQWNISSQSC